MQELNDVKREIMNAVLTIHKGPRAVYECPREVVCE
jgi:hypothetical protein